MRTELVRSVSLLLALVATGLGAQVEGETLARLDGTAVEVAEIERRIPELMEKVWVPGMSVLVVRDGAIAYRQNFGTRSARTGEPITPSTSFAGLSFSKTITAYLVMRMVEKGLFDLDRPLHSYLQKPVPKYDFYTDLAGDEAHLAITARHVLSHTTGWPNWRWFMPGRKLAFLFPPGERHSYSGEGFAYLQLALEEATGKAFEELAQRFVFAPLDMSRSSMLWQPSYEADFAEDHDLLGRPLRRDRRDNASAAGSLQTTIGDYARFLMAVLSAQGLEPARRDAMIAPHVPIRHARMFGPRIYEETTDHRERGLAWTLGFGRVETPFGPAFFHTGNDMGSANYAIAFPERRAAVVLMGNSNRLEGIAEDVVELLTGDSSSPFDFLGYLRFDGPRQRWLKTLADNGPTAGRAYWESLGQVRVSEGLDDEEAFARGAEALAHFRTLDEALELQSWRRELFPTSSSAVRDSTKLLLGRGRARQAVALVDSALEALGTDSGLEWFATWTRALANPTVMSVERLADCAGEYGPRRFELRAGRLFYGRDQTLPSDYQELTAMGADTFVLPDADFFRLRFEFDDAGKAVRVHGEYEDGRVDSNDRSAPAKAPSR